MPSKVIWSNHGATKKYWGSLTYKDIESADNALFGDYRFDGIQYLVIDCMDVIETLLEDEAIDVLAHTDHVASSYKRTLKMAFACNLPKLTLQFQKYISESASIGNRWDIRMFTDLQSAEAWVKS